MKHAKRMLSLLLTLLLLVNLIPATFAADSGSDPPALEAVQVGEQEAGEPNVTEDGDTGDSSATVPNTANSEEPSAEVEAPPASEEISEPIEPSMTDVTEETAPSTEASEVPSEEAPPASEEVSEPTEPSTTEIVEESAEPIKIEDNPHEDILPNDASGTEPIAKTAGTRASGSPIVHGGNSIVTNGTLTIRYYNYLDGTNKTAYIQAIDLKTIGSAAVYCIEPEESSTGQSYTQDESKIAWNKIPPNTREAITLALAYGYPNQSYSASPNDIYWYGKQAVLNTENYIATQLIVWEILAGIRSSTSPYGLTGSASYRNAFDSGWNTIRTTYDAIAAKMAKHNMIPAYASGLRGEYVYTLQYDSSTGTYRYMLPAERQSDWRECRITLPDGISYLKAADGMTVIGFEATTEAAAALPENGTTCTGTSPYLSVAPDTAVMCWQCSNSQTVAAIPVTPDPAPAYFTLKAAMYEELEIIKTSPDGKVDGITFYIKNASGTEVGRDTTKNGGKLTFPDLIVGQTYTVVEVVPEGYVCENNNQAITIQAGANTVTFANRPLASLNIIKTSPDGKVDGIAFTLEEWVPGIGYCRIGTYTTDENGEISIPDRTVGTTYRVTELVPDGYVCENNNQTITIQAGTNTVTFANRPLPSLKIIKQSPDGNVAGISFEVYAGDAAHQSGTVLQTVVTGTDGTVQIDKLEAGTYWIRELVPEHYAAQEDQKVVVTEENTADNPAVVTFTNVPLAPLNVVKASPDGEVDDIEFYVKDSSGAEVGRDVTKNGGKLTFPGLVVGQTYTVTEVVPEGYICEENNQSVTIHAGTNSVTFTNKPISLKIIKQSPDGNVAGISFEVYAGDAAHQSGTVLQTVVTGTDGTVQLDKLKAGTYWIRELVPDHYAEQEDQKVVVTEENTADNPAVVTFTNVPLAPLNIVKTSPDGKVDGIEFYIRDSNGAEVGRDTTKNGGKLTFPDLVVGQTYTVTEVVPEGYVCEQNNQSITIQAGTNTVSFTNKPISLKIVKQSPDGNVAGISFQIYKNRYSNKVEVPVYATVTTGADGTFLLDKLEPATYYVKEIVPEGYAPQAVKSIEVTADNTSDNPAVVTFTNAPLASLEVIKICPDGNVDGIEFYVEDLYGLEVGRDVTHDGGKLTFTNMVVGKTYIVSEVVPEGYVCKRNHQRITIQEGTNTVTFENDTAPSLKIIKKSPDGNVAGITFEVYLLREDPQFLMGTYTTNENGEIPLHVNRGMYCIKEIVPEGYEPQGVKSVSVTEANFGGNPAVVTFTNVPYYGKISVSKVNLSNVPLSGATFLLEYSTDDGATWSAAKPATETDNGIGTCSTVDADGTITTGADGTAVFDKLLISGVTYRLTETVAPAGYQLLAEPVFTGKLAAGDNGSTVIYREVVNVPVLQMPPAGGDGSMSFLVSSSVIISVVSALWLFLLLQKQRKANNKSKN